MPDTDSRKIEDDVANTSAPNHREKVLEDVRTGWVKKQNKPKKEREKERQAGRGSVRCGCVGCM